MAHVVHTDTRNEPGCVVNTLMGYGVNASEVWNPLARSPHAPRSLPKPWEELTWSSPGVGRWQRFGWRGRLP